MLASDGVRNRIQSGLIPDQVAFHLYQEPVKNTKRITGTLQSARSKTGQKCDRLLFPP